MGVHFFACLFQCSRPYCYVYKLGNWPQYSARNRHRLATNGSLRVLIFGFLEISTLLWGESGPYWCPKEIDQQISWAVTVKSLQSATGRKTAVDNQVHQKTTVQNSHGQTGVTLMDSLLTIYCLSGSTIVHGVLSIDLKICISMCLDIL